MKPGRQPDGTAKDEPKPQEGVEALRRELEAERARADEYKGLLQRVQADFENHIKRSEAQRRGMVIFANKDLIVRLLEVVDTMDAALKAEPADDEEKRVLDGFKRVAAKLWSVLSAEGLAEVDATGAFDLSVHEAVETVEDDCRPDGTIVDVVQKGYRLNGTLIRTSKVIVVKNRGDGNG